MKDEIIRTVGTISSDYETYADVYHYKGAIYCVYTETTDHVDHSETVLVVASSRNQGQSWSLERLPFKKSGVPFWCRPRFLKGNTNRLIIVCNLTQKIDQDGEIYMIEYFSGSWMQPQNLEIYGILSGNPIALKSGDFLLPVHSRNEETAYYEQHIYKSNDFMTWNSSVLSKDGYDLSNAQIVEWKNNILLLAREKTISGWDMYFSISKDNGSTWETIKKVAFKGVCNFAIDVYRENVYMAFSRDMYNDRRKTLKVANTDLYQFLKNYKLAQFYALAENKNYSFFSETNIGYTGIDIKNHEYVFVDVSKIDDNHHTLIEAHIGSMQELEKNMSKYHL